MDYVKPNQVMDDMIEAGAAKARLKTSQMIIRGMLSGAILACATTLAFTASDQTNIPMVGALLFPVGFVMIVLLGLELVTGSFALLPLAVLQKKASGASMLANYGWVILGHVLGCLIYGGLYTLAATRMGTDMSHPLVQMIIDTSETKTLGYKALGVSGMLLVVIKAMLCNWMVTLGVVMAFTSSSTIGKIVAMWLPILVFFGQGFEHAVVNMFVIPAGMMLGADVSMADWWLWNQIPVLIGNFIGGAVFTGTMLHLSHFGFGKRSEVNPIGKVHHGLRVMEATAVPVDKRR